MTHVFRNTWFNIRGLLRFLFVFIMFFTSHSTYRCRAVSLQGAVEGAAIWRQTAQAFVAAKEVPVIAPDTSSVCDVYKEYSGCTRLWWQCNLYQSPWHPPLFPRQAPLFRSRFLLWFSNLRFILRAKCTYISSLHGFGKLKSKTVTFLAMKAYVGLQLQPHSFLTPTPYESARSASPRQLYPRVGPTSGPKSCRKRVPDCLAPRLANTVSVKWVSISPLISSRSYIQAHTTDKFLFPSSRSPELQEHTNITSHHSPPLHTARTYLHPFVPYSFP